MSLYDTLRKSLTPELFTSVTDALGDDFDYDVVPRSRLNKVIKQRNELRDQLTAGSQSAGGKNKGSSGDDDDDDFEMPGKGKQKEVDIEALKQQWMQEQGDAVSAVKMQYAALEKLRAAGAIDADLIWQAGLIDKSKLTVEADGSIKGLDEAITDLTKNRAQLFSKQDDKGGKKDVPGGTGKTGGDDGFENVTTKEEFLKLSTEQQMAFKKANPDVFKSFLN